VATLCVVKLMKMALISGLLNGVCAKIVLLGSGVLNVWIVNSHLCYLFCCTL